MSTSKSRKAVKPPSFRSLMTFQLHMVARLSERISENYYRKHLNLSLPECRVIGITASYGSVSFKQVAADANLEKSYASRVVAALVERGIVEKLTNPSDSRSVLLQLTKYGHSVHRQTYALALRLNAVLQAPFAPEQVEEFVAFLGTLEQHLDRAEALVEVAVDRPTATAAAPALGESNEAGETPAQLDHAFARQLHELLGKYLAAKK